MMRNLPNPKLLQASRLAETGWPILPLFEPTASGCSCGDPACSHIGKHPRTRGGVHDATTDQTAIADWWRRWPNANLGLATGAKSGLFVLDVDGKKGRATLAALSAGHEALPIDAKVLTGRGEHIYFRSKGLQVRNIRLGPGLDLRGDGGYVVTLLSLHASGWVYQHPHWGRPGMRLRLARPPDWLLAAMAPRTAPIVSKVAAGAREAGYAEAALDSEIDRLRQAREGERNTTLNTAAFRVGQLVGGNILEASTVSARLMETACQIGLSEAEAAATIRGGLEAGQQSPRMVWALSAPSRPSDVVDPLAQELAQLGETDADNAQRLARRFGDRLTCTPGKGYLVYDGQRWGRDDQRRRYKLAEETARAIAAEAEHCKDRDFGAQRVKFATASLSKAGLDRMLDVAQHRLMRADRDFDADHFQLNVENGTVDLRTGRLLPHDPAHLITKLVPVAFDPKAACQTFKRFLDHALKQDGALIDYVQKAIGYGLTGSVAEQVFFFPFGPGSTGKSTFVNLIRDLLGDYGLHTPTETFTAKQYDNGIPADLARLEGARMVTAVEVNWSRQIDEARIKALTGGDPIAARHLYRDFFEFQPACKLWLVANDLPGVRGTAEAFWRRARVIPFEVVIPEHERDLDLTTRLQAERPGILAWAVRGCLAWQRDGLEPPEAVRRGTEGWQRKADHVARFCNGELIFDRENNLSSQELNQRYRSWCEKHGERPLDTRKLKAALEGQNMTSKHTRMGTVWSGVKLRLHG